MAIRKKYKLSDTTSKILDFNSKGLSNAEIASELGFTIKRVGKIVYNHKLSPNRKGERISTKEILRLHKLGVSVPNISKEVNKNNGGIRAILHFYGLKSNKHEYERSDNLIEDYFKEINSQRCAYFFGLIYSDGNVFSKDRSNIVSIGLQEEDGYLIEEFKKDIGSDNKISKKELGGHYKNYLSIAINSKKMVSDLISHGCIPKKSLVKRLPNIKEEFFGSFLRGYFDGNGCASIQKKGNWTAPRISICSSLTFLNELKSVLGIKHNIKCPKIEVRKNNIGVLYICNKDGVTKFSNLIYEHDSISLERKKKLLYG